MLFQNGLNVENRNLARLIPIGTETTPCVDLSRPFGPPVRRRDQTHTPVDVAAHGTDDRVLIFVRFGDPQNNKINGLALARPKGFELLTPSS
jgi:hypothetical protein